MGEGDRYIMTGQEYFRLLVDVFLMPFKRVYVFLMSIDIYGVKLGSVILVGILFSIVIGVITHYSGSIGNVFKIFRKGKND